MLDYHKLSVKDRKLILSYVEDKTGATASMIEKDWWATIALKALSLTDDCNLMVFKGGTSLAKQGLIKRISEDIDIALDYRMFTDGRSENEMSRNYITEKIRRGTCNYAREILPSKLEKALELLGLREGKDFVISVNENNSTVSTTDPETIFLRYKSALQYPNYISPWIKIEMKGHPHSHWL